MLDIALVLYVTKVQATMTETSSGRRVDSSGQRWAIATDALLGVLAGLLTAQLAPWGDGDIASTSVSVLIGGLLGAVIARFFRRHLLVALDAALLAIYLVVAMTPIMTPVTRSWVRVDPLPANQPDAVVALSAGVKSDSALSAVGADRLIGAIELVHDGHGRRLVTTRHRERAGSVTISSEEDQRRLIGLASLTGVWTIVDSVQTTHDEAVRAAAVLLPAGARSIVVVTSPMHTRRACAVFEAVGFHVYCRASRERAAVTNPPFASLDRLGALRAYGYERLAMIKYGLKGWLTPRPVVTPTPGGSS